jgi:hypothetical protein
MRAVIVALFISLATIIAPSYAATTKSDANSVRKADKPPVSKVRPEIKKPKSKRPAVIKKRSSVKKTAR